MAAARDDEFGSDDGSTERRDRVEAVNRRPARSGRVSYGDPIVLRDSGQTQVQFVPFFINRSDGSNLSIKLLSYAKRPDGFRLREEKSLSLDEQAARRLFNALRTHLAVTEESEDGRYLVIRLGEGGSNLSAHDPQEVAGALADILGSPDIAPYLAGLNLSDELSGALRGAMRVSEMRNAVAQLRNLLDSGVADEHSYQVWCEQHSWAFGNAYVLRDDVRDISISDTADLLLPSAISGFRDIVELKRPDVPVLRYDEAHRNYFFSQDTSRAIGQCHRYIEVLHEEAANGLRDHLEIVAYHPRALVVIGRSAEWPKETVRALHGLNRRLVDVTVMTYDQLLIQGERLLEILGESSSTSDDWDQDFDPKDLPF